MEFPTIDDATRLKLLAPPEGAVDMVLDTDTYNEIDDQFAVVYSLLSPQRLNVEALYAAPFHNTRSTGPADGMAKSYDEILRLLDRLGRPDACPVLKGSTSYLPGADEPVVSAAAEDLVARAMADREGPLYVVGIGAITNVASAILMEPKIIERIVVVWLAGQPLYWHHAGDFNMNQDTHAARVLFDSGVPFVFVPCSHVAQLLRTTAAELAAHVKGHNAISDYLYESFCAYHDDHFAWAKEIWDVAPIAWLINPQWIPSTIMHSPILTDQRTWSADPFRHVIRVAVGCNRNEIFGDLFRKLQAAT